MKMMGTVLARAGVVGLTAGFLAIGVFSPAFAVEKVGSANSIKETRHDVDAYVAELHVEPTYAKDKLASFDVKLAAKGNFHIDPKFPHPIPCRRPASRHQIRRPRPQA